MGRRRRGVDIDGVILLDKPAGLSSNQALQRVRRAFDARKAGHTGSLDPLATGLLPICLGEATKLSSYLLAADKSYRVTARIGTETTTGDAEGEVSRHSDTPAPKGQALHDLLAGFVGAQEQIPPMYSALKVDGRPLYDYARAGQTIERSPRPITVYAIDYVAADDATLTLDVTVSSGTYVRTLIEDIARAWGGCAHVAALRRTRVGGLGRMQPMTTLSALEDEHTREAAKARAIYPLSALIADWPPARLNAEQARAIVTGQRVPGPWHVDDRLLRIEDEQGRLLGLGECRESGVLRPKRLFARPQR